MDLLSSKAWVAALDIFTLGAVLEQIELLDNRVNSDLQSDLIFKLQRMF